MYGRDNVKSSKVSLMSRVLVGVALIAILLLLLSFVVNVFYMRRIEAHEIGLPFASGRLREPVGPGFYLKVGWMVEMEVISMQAIPFRVEDPEVINITENLK